MKKLFFIAVLSVSVTTAIAQAAGKAAEGLTEHTFVSVTNSDRDYTLKAALSVSLMEKVKGLVEKNLGNAADSAVGLYVWNVKNIYTITMKQESLSIDMDKGRASQKLIQIFEVIGDEIQQMTIRKANKAI